MARYRLTGPDGKTYEVTAPDDAAEDQVLSYFRSNLDKASPAKQSVGIGEGFGRQALDSATFGLNDMASAALKTPFGGTYQENLARERARTKAAVDEPISTIAGRTAGMTAQGILTMPLAAGSRLYQGARSALEPVSRPLGQAIESGVGAVRNALLTRPESTTRAAMAAREIGEEASRPATSALASWAEGLPGAARYGVAFGGADAAGHSSGNIPETFMNTAEGMAAGAVLGPAFHSAAFGAGNLLSRHQLARQRRADAVAANVADARAVGINDPLGPAMADGARPWVAKAVEVGVGGKPIGDKASANIAEWERGMNRVLGNAVDGKEAGDLGKSVQQDLRRALVDRSKSGDEVRGLSDDGISQITGPIGENGFNRPPPKVDPVQPRMVDPVQPRDIGPEPTRPPIQDRIPELEAAYARKEQEIGASIAEYNKLADSLNAGEAQSGVGLSAIGINSVKSMPDGSFVVRKFGPIQTGPTGRPMRGAPSDVIVRPNQPYTPDQLGFNPDQWIAIQREIARQQHFASTKPALDQRVNKLREIYAEQDAIATELARSRATAEAERVRYEQARTDFEQARTRAQAEAAAETQRLRDVAAREAEEATRLAQQQAERLYQEEVAAGRNTFQAGRSRESYPTEFDAAYEAIDRAAPTGTFNPLGDGYSKTGTYKLLFSVADDATKSLKLQGFSGDIFGGPNGSFDPAFAGYLRARLGDDVTSRLVQMAERRGPVGRPSQLATRQLYIDLGRMAREAERPPFPAQPRTEDAALMRRLQKALKDDFYADMSQRGVSPSFTTESGIYTNHGKRTTRAGMPQTDQTYFLRPDHVPKLLGEPPPLPDRISRTLPTENIVGQNHPTRGPLVGKHDPVTRQFNRSTMMPHNRHPDPGLVPVEVWDGGNRLRVGTPIQSRAPTEGERAVSMFRIVDTAHREYINELRRPLAKIFGDNVEPVQAMDRLVTAAMKGETSIVRAYARVMREKSDPVKGASAVLHHMSGGGRDMAQFLKSWREMKDVSKDALFAGQKGTQLRREIERFVRVGERLERFARSSKPRAIVDPSRISHMATASAFFANAPAVVAMVGGNAALARMLSSPRYLRWISEVPDSIRGGFQTPMFRRHMERLSAIGVTEDDQRIGEGIGRALVQAFGQREQK